MAQRDARVLLAFALLGAALWWWNRRAQDFAVVAPDLAQADGFEAFVAALLPSSSFVDSFGAVAADLSADLAGVAADLAERVTVPAWKPIPAAAPYLDLVARAEADNGIPANLLARQIQKESAWRPRAYNAASGASGIAQFLPATAAEWGCDPWIPEQAIPAMGRYMRWLHGRHGSWALALAAYNWGTGNLARYGFDARPKETRDYVDAITRDVPVA